MQIAAQGAVIIIICVGRFAGKCSTRRVYMGGWQCGFHKTLRQKEAKNKCHISSNSTDEFTFESSSNK